MMNSTLLHLAEWWQQRKTWENGDYDVQIVDDGINTSLPDYDEGRIERKKSFYNKAHESDGWPADLS